MFDLTIIVGHLGKEPEMRYTPNGKAVTSFSVATNRSWYDSNKVQHKDTTWYRISSWGAQAEACNQYLHKGSLVLVIGRLRSDPSGNPALWTGNDGIQHASFEVNAERVVFLHTKGQGESTELETQDAAPAVEEENLPF